MTERPYHHGNLRAALLDRAEEMLRSGGDLSLRSLARDIGVSHAAPRRHFPDRQALLDALAAIGFERLGLELRAAAEAAPDELQPRMEAIGIAYVGFATRDAALLELMFAGKSADPTGPLHDAAEDAFAVVLTALREAQASGALDPGEPEAVGLPLFATMQGMAAFVNTGWLDPALVEVAVKDAVARYLRGSRSAARVG